jgi:hypothetical protein
VLRMHRVSQYSTTRAWGESEGKGGKEEH